MPPINLACETYTWQMPGEQYKGKLDHIMGLVSQAGFKGIEIETSFIRHLDDPVLMQETLDKHELQLAVLCVVEDWLYPQETVEERGRADKWIDFLGHFPGAMLLTVQMPQQDRAKLRERQNNMIACVNDFSRRAAEKGIVCSNHPNSPAGSVFRVEADYEILLKGLDQQATGFCPDVGHIAKGGMDPAEIIRRYRSQVNLVHYKDMYEDGRWAFTGEGTIDFAGITQYLMDTGYEGWIIMEDECDECITDPDGVTLRDGVWIREVLEPML